MHALIWQREGNRKAPTLSSELEGPKTPDPKTLRRLAQNMEAARKSRLRKKGMFFGGGGDLLGGEQGLPIGINNISSEAAVFDIDYARWQEEHHRLMCELRATVQEHLPENELRIFVDNYLAHFDEMVNLKGMQLTQEAEEALSQGLEALNRSLYDIITSNSLSCPHNMTNYMGQMAIAMNKLSTLEGFVRQVCQLHHHYMHYSLA
ncbi:hypothetical protein REPUB_Repub16aG0110200 [Reevesia pubescens]